MTVNELIEALQAMPPDHPVIMRVQSFSSLGSELNLVYRSKTRRSQKFSCTVICDDDEDDNALNAVTLEAT